MVLVEIFLMGFQKFQSFFIKLPFPLDGDNIPKGVLIPNVITTSHEDVMKDGLYL